MDLGLKDKVVIVLSSAAGIGKGIATEVAREGAKVVIATAELEQAQADIEKETGNKPYCFYYDVLDDASIKSALDNLILSNTFRMGVVGMSKTMAREFGPYGILVNTMGPGRIYTDRIKYLNKIRGEKLGMTEEEYTKKDSAGFPQRRYQSTDEYGRMAAFLVSPANGSMSGQAFINDGAMTTSY